MSSLDSFLLLMSINYWDYHLLSHWPELTWSNTESSVQNQRRFYDDKNRDKNLHLTRQSAAFKAIYLKFPPSEATLIVPICLDQRWALPPPHRSPPIQYLHLSFSPFTTFYSQLLSLQCHVIYQMNFRNAFPVINLQLRYQFTTLKASFKPTLIVFVYFLEFRVIARPTRHNTTHIIM